MRLTRQFKYVPSMRSCAKVSYGHCPGPKDYVRVEYKI